jgi:hypothetical protein
MGKFLFSEARPEFNGAIAFKRTHQTRGDLRCRDDFLVFVANT